MSIQSEITLLQNTKKNLKSAIMEKGVTVYPSDIFSTYPTRISQISMTPGDKDNLFSELIDRSITSFVIPNGTSSIRSFCFSDCLSLTSVTIPNTVTTIGSNSFTKTGLTSVTIPESVTFIGKLAFFLSNSLTSITCLSETPPALGNYNNAFDNTNDCPIYVPRNSVLTYKTAWSTYASRIQAIPQPQQQKLVRITDPADATSGYYLAAYSNAYALDASQVKTTTRSGGLNGNPNTVDLSEQYDSHADEFLATEDVMTHAFYFDAENGKMSWTDPDTDTTYYISYKSRGDNGFNYTNTTTVPTSTVTVGYVMEGYTELTFKDGSYCLNANSETFQWIGIGACHIYKLTE
ncbi:MAG: leucine-rich repeat domain-containing protein [Prevotella sp.]|nr:leucine-rich repeat domain-containing protein [Prevotella sp.]